MKVKHITEAISSKQIEDHVQDVLKKHLATNDDVKNFSTVVKRALKDILKDYNIDLPVEVSVKTQPKTTYADISVSVDKNTHEAVELSSSFILNKDKMNDDMDSFLYKLRQTMVHEMVHVIQTVRANYKDSISTVRRKDFQHEKPWKEYLADKKEIEAYAVNAAQELRDKNVDPDKLEKYLKNNELIKKLGNSRMSPTFTEYFDIFYNSSDKKDQQVWKRFIKRFLHHVDELMRDKQNINEDDNDSNDEMPDHVKEKFVELGEQQRDRPEKAMLQTQQIAGSGALNVVIEHTGDLIHRMSHAMKRPHSNDGYEYVREKLDKVIPLLNQAYGFEKEMEENLQRRAEMKDIEYSELRKKVDDALRIYAKTHDELTPYNEVQWLAKRASINLGLQSWDRATFFLKELDRYAKNRETWHKKATEYELNDSGELKEYTPR